MHPRPFWTAVSFAAVYAACTVGSSIALSYVIDEVILGSFLAGSPQGRAFVIGAGLVIGVGLLRAAAIVGRRSFAGIAQWRTSETLARRVVDRVMAQPPVWRRRRMTGDLVARAGVDCDTSVAVMAPLPFGTSVILLLVLAAAWMVTVDRVLGLLASSVIPVLLVMNVGYQRIIDRHYGAAQEHLGLLSAAVHESFEGVTVVKAFGAEARETERLSGISGRLRDARIRAVRGRATFEGLLDAVPGLVNVAIIYVGSLRVRDSAITIGELSSFVYLFTLLIFPLRIVGYVLSELPHSLSGWARVSEVLDEPVGPDPRSAITRDCEGVTLRDVWLTHDDGESPTLAGVDLVVPRGSSMAVVGPTGCGKSTLLAVVVGLLAPDRGEVCVGDWPPSLVPQDPFLFSDSIRDNVALGATAASEESVAAALAVAVADEFVDELEVGVDTVVGERGVGLSGGQRQRVALARAFATQSGVVVLDDTTSALDPETEHAVVEGMIGTGRTVLLVASRPSTAALVDRVAWMVDGRILDVGTHDELTSRRPDYAALMASFEVDRSEDSP
jgi:ATP-binding cassette subfamily B protein